MDKLRPSTVHRWAFLATIVCCVLGGTASAQEVKIAPLLKSGDEFTIEIARAREDSARPGQATRGVTPVDVRVATATSDGLVLDWIQGESRITGSQSADPLVQAALNALRGLTLRLALNPDGEFTGLVNRDEVASQIQKAADLMVQGLMEKLPAEQRAPVQKLIAQLLSPSVLLLGVARDAQTYFSLNGISLAVGETVEVELEQPNPLGGDPLPAAFRITMESATGDSALGTTTTTYDATAILRSTRALAEKSGKPIPESELAAFPTMEMQDDGRFVLDRTVGLMRELVVNRRISAGNQQRLDRWEIRLVRAPQR